MLWTRWSLLSTWCSQAGDSSPPARHTAALRLSPCCARPLSILLQGRGRGFGSPRGRESSEGKSLEDFEVLARNSLPPKTLPTHWQSSSAYRRFIVQFCLRIRPFRAVACGRKAYFILTLRRRTSMNSLLSSQSLTWRGESGTRAKSALFKSACSFLS